jgi:hypothetical protein
MPSGKSYSSSFGALLDIDEVVGCAGMVRREIAIDHLVAEMPCAYSRGFGERDRFDRLTHANKLSACSEVCLFSLFPAYLS